MSAARRNPKRDQRQLDLHLDLSAKVDRRADEIAMPARFRKPKSWREVESMIGRREVQMVSRRGFPAMQEWVDCPPDVSAVVLVRGISSWYRAVSFTIMNGIRNFSFACGAAFAVTDLRAFAVHKTMFPEAVWSKIQDGSWGDRSSTDHWYR